MWYSYYLNNYKNATVDYTRELTNDELLVNVSLAGKSKDDVSVSVEDKYLIVKVEEKSEKETLTFDIPIYVQGVKYDLDSVKATMEHGLLSISVPRLKNKERQIKIN